MAGIGAYDPRQQAHISLTYKTPQPQLTASKSFEQSQLFASGRQGSTQSSSALPRRSYTPSAPGSKQSPADTPHFSRQRTEWEGAVHPPFLNRDSRWEQEGLPSLMTYSHGQPLTTTGRLDGTRGLVQAPKAISAVYTYNDISPVLTTEYTRDTDKTEVAWDATINKQGTAGVYVPAGPAPPSPLHSLVDKAMATRTNPLKQTTSIGNPETRKSSVDAFWHRNGSSSHLKQQDVTRIGEELGSHAVPGSANSKLVAGKWRFLTRPIEGTHLYTDYYGRCAEKHCDYYGRMYHYLPQ